ncbi:uncharacterized protein LOC142750370 [Rhinoderma darwinii]|uniref:uncharacterized protein LOC142750370 n=1 Tax=Rhinoderma darwinii TaxID=43563 RepID=UPI003F67CCE9
MVNPGPEPHLETTEALEDVRSEEHIAETVDSKGTLSKALEDVRSEEHIAETVDSNRTLSKKTSSIRKRPALNPVRKIVSSDSSRESSSQSRKDKKSSSTFQMSGRKRSRKSRQRLCLSCKQPIPDNHETDACTACTTPEVSTMVQNTKLPMANKMSGRKRSRKSRRRLCLSCNQPLPDNLETDVCSACTTSEVSTMVHNTKLPITQGSEDIVSEEHIAEETVDSEETLSKVEHISGQNDTALMQYEEGDPYVNE